MEKSKLTITVEKEETKSTLTLRSIEDTAYIMVTMIKILNQLTDEVLLNKEK